MQLRTDGPSDSCFPKARPVSDFQPMLMRWSQLLQPGYAASANRMCNQRPFRFTLGQKMAPAARVTAQKCVLGGWGGRQALAAPLTAGKRGFGDIGGGGTREGGKTWLKIKRACGTAGTYISTRQQKRHLRHASRAFFLFVRNTERACGHVWDFRLHELGEKLIWIDAMRCSQKNL